MFPRLWLALVSVWSARSSGQRLDYDSWIDLQGALSEGLCRYGNRIECCWGWTLSDRGRCQPHCPHGCKHGECVAPDKCRCQPGFTGKTCNQDLNECGLKPRPCKHRCMNTVGSYKCYCLDGHKLQPDGTCRNARTCFHANCQYGCEVIKGAVRCTCPSPGLRLGPDGRICVDIDECVSVPGACPRRRKCVNTFGSYVCKCHFGFKLTYINGRYNCIDKDTRPFCSLNPDAPKCKCKDGSCKAVPKVKVEPQTPRTTSTAPPTTTTTPATTTTTPAPTTTTPATTTTTPAPTTTTPATTTTTPATTTMTPATTTTTPVTTTTTPVTTTTTPTTTTTTPVTTTTTPATTTTPPVTTTTTPATTTTTTVRPIPPSTAAITTPPAPTTSTTLSPPTTVITTTDPPPPLSTTTTAASTTNAASTTALITASTTAPPVPSTTITMKTYYTTDQTTTPLTTTELQRTMEQSTAATTPALKTTTTSSSSSSSSLSTTTVNNRINKEVTHRPRGDVHIPRHPSHNQVWEFDIELGNTAEDAKDDAEAGVLHCSFERGLCDWTSEREGDLHWETTQGPRGERYLSVPQLKVGQRSVRGARLSVPIVPPWSLGDLCFSFSHWLTGHHVGVLQLFLRSKGRDQRYGSAVWSRTGGHGWRHTQVTLSKHSVDRVLLKAERRSRHWGQMAVDDLTLRRGACR